MWASETKESDKFESQVAESKRRKVVKYLLEAKADINIKSDVSSLCSTYAHAHTHTHTHTHLIHCVE